MKLISIKLFSWWSFIYLWLFSVIAEIVQQPIISIQESLCIKFTENWTANDRSNSELYLLLRHLEKIIKSVFNSIQKSVSDIMNKNLNYQFHMKISAYLIAWLSTRPGNRNLPVHIFRHISVWHVTAKGSLMDLLRK